MMKKYSKKITSVLLTLTLIFGCTCLWASAETAKVSPDEHYIALMKATDWSLYEDHSINIQRAQIPDYLLNQMTTEQLINAVLHYPYLIDMLCYDTYSAGFESVSKYFNDLSELLNRKDSAQKLAERLESTPVQRSHSVDGEAVMNGMFLDVLLAQPEFMNQFSEQETEEVLEMVDKTIEERLTQPDIYGETEAYMFYQAANENIEAYITYAVVYTPKNTPVNVLAKGASTPVASQQYWIEYVKNGYPTANIIGPADENFNCHSYAWYSQSRDNPYWMPDEEANKYMNDGSYRKISGFQESAKIYYGSDTLGRHSGICFVEGLVYSKWGSGPLVSHKWTNCPYYNVATPVSYWVLA